MKKFINKIKRGFTLVELTIVIAVIAILIAVLVPTFIALIDSANESKDTQMIYNVNQVLSIENENINTVSDALDIAAEAGYNIDKLTPSSDGEIVYDHATKSFALISTEGEVIYPTSNSSLDLNAPTTYYFVDEATYTALNTTTSASVSYSLAKTTVKSATDGETAGGTTPKEHTKSYVATGEWTGEFNYTGMGAIDTTRAKGITSVSYTSKTVKNDKDYKLNVAYYIAESSADNYSLTVTITESVDTIYASVASNVIFNISVTADSPINIVQANENAAPALCDEATKAKLTITINGTDVTEDYVVETNENAVVENGVLQLGTEKYPWLIASADDSSKITKGTYCKVTADKITITSAINIASGTEVILNLNGNTLTISGASSNSHIINNGTLTITDSSTAKNGSLIVSSATYGIKNNGTLYITGGTIEGKNVIYLNNSSASLYMTGGTITGTTYGVYANACNNLTITGEDTKISATGTSFSSAILIKNYSTATISDATVSGGEDCISLTTRSADVTIEGVNVGAASGAGINVGGSGTVYIKDCTVSVSNSFALSLGEASKVEVDGGTYTNTTTDTTDSSTKCALNVTDMSVVTVKKGTFTCQNGAGAAYTSSSSSCKLIISGGTFNGNIRAGSETTVEISGGEVNGNITLETYSVNNTKYATMTISGGSFDGTLTIGTTCILTITGGKFTNDPSSYVDEDEYTVSESSGTKYTYTVTATSETSGDE